MRKHTMFGMLFSIGVMALTACQGSEAVSVKSTETMTAGTIAMDETTAIQTTGENAEEKEKLIGEVKLTLVHTNDVHSYVDVEPYVKSFVRNLRETEEHVMLISAGDVFAGTPFASLSEGMDVAMVMNDAGYELLVIGNHDQDVKYAPAIAALDFPVLGRNASEEILAANPQMVDYIIRDFGGVKVAFLGITTINSSPEGEGAKWLEYFNGIYEAAKAEGADIYIAVSHLGVTDQDETLRSTYIAENCPWLTAMIDAHCHTAHENGLMHNNVLIAETGEYGNNIGVVEITINDGVVSDRSARLIPIKENEEQCEIKPDADLTAKIAEITAKNTEYLETVVAQIPVDLEGERENCRTSETNFGNLIADAQRWKTNADIAVVEGYFIRQSVPAGPLTNEVLLSMFLAPRSIYTKNITGQELYDIMEKAIGTYPEQSSAFLQVSGIKVQFDPSKEAGSRIIELHLSDGTSIEMNNTYSYAHLGEAAEDAEFGTISEAFLDYLNETKLVPEVEGRIVPVE